MKGESLVQVIFGRKGSGKSTLASLLLKKYSRVIYFDFLNEHKKSAKWSVKDARTFIAFDKKHPNESVIFASHIYDDEDDHAHEIEMILNYLYKIGENSDRHKDTVLVFEESQFYFPEKFLSFTLKKFITGGRHAQLNQIHTTQRPAQVSKGLVQSADEIFISRIAEKNDREYIKKSFPEEVIEKIDTLKHGDFLKYSNNTQEIEIIEVLKKCKVIIP